VLKTAYVGIRKVGSERKDEGKMLSSSKNPERCSMWQVRAVHGDVGIITFVHIKDVENVWRNTKY
jgi:hypothetical protein